MIPCRPDREKRVEGSLSLCKIFSRRPLYYQFSTILIELLSSSLSDEVVRPHGSTVLSSPSKESR